MDMLSPTLSTNLGILPMFTSRCLHVSPPLPPRVWSAVPNVRKKEIWEIFLEIPRYGRHLKDVKFELEIFCHGKLQLSFTKLW